MGAPYRGPNAGRSLISLTGGPSLQPLAIVLLLRFPRAGLIAALAIMLTDVGINSLAALIYWSASSRYAVGYFVQLQTAFLGFVLGSAPFLWRHLGCPDAASPRHATPLHH